jgi:hypothetical protein
MNMIGISKPELTTLIFLSIIPLYYLIRKPTLILDFSLTLLFNHIVITTYKTGSFPTSFWFWVVMVSGALVMVVGAEQVRSVLPPQLSRIRD